MTQIQHVGEQRSLKKELLENTFLVTRPIFSCPIYHPQNGESQNTPYT